MRSPATDSPYQYFQGITIQTSPIDSGSVPGAVFGSNWDRRPSTIQISSGATQAAEMRHSCTTRSQNHGIELDDRVASDVGNLINRL